jgi:hypothetical protein
MGYTILIGNAELFSEWNNTDYAHPQAEWQVKGMSLDEAPYSSDLTGKSNERSPSYTVWADFVRSVGLYEMFYNEYIEGLMDQHSGCARLTQEHADKIRSALERYKQLHPDSIASFCECKSCSDPWSKSDASHNPKADPTLVRLTWLDFWANWAVKNCERPAIYNY